MSDTFIPKKACTVASGDCLVEGRCLRKCTTRLSADDANVRLTDAIRLLEVLSVYTVQFRTMTGYLDGSTIDKAVKEARKLIEDVNG